MHHGGQHGIETKQGVNESLKDPHWMKKRPLGAIAWLYI